MNQFITVVIVHTFLTQIPGFGGADQCYKCRKDENCKDPSKVDCPSGTKQVCFIVTQWNGKVEKGCGEADLFKEFCAEVNSSDFSKFDNSGNYASCDVCDGNLCNKYDKVTSSAKIYKSIPVVVLSSLNILWHQF